MNTFIRNFDLKSDTEKFLPIFWEYWCRVNQEDKSEIVEIKIKDDLNPMKMPGIEALLYYYLSNAFNIKICEDDKEIIGFMIYRHVFTHMIQVPAFYFIEEYRKTYAAKDFVDSIYPEIKRIVFQTRKENPPERLLEITKGKRHVVFEDDKLITWEMEWNYGRGTRSKRNSTAAGTN